MKIIRSDLILLSLTLAVALLSVLFLGRLWFLLTMDGRSFPSYFGIFSLIALVDSIPFTWPFLVAGFLYRQRLISYRSGWNWTLAVGVAGTCFHLCVYTVDFVGGKPVEFARYIDAYLPHAFPILFAVFGFFAAHFIKRFNAKIENAT